MVERRQVRLRLALPWLKAFLGAQAVDDPRQARAPALEWLVARGHTLDGPVPDWRTWLLEDVPGGAGLLRQCPAGPCTRAHRTGVRPAGTWACARPVHLLTAIDHLQLAEEPVALDAGEAATLLGDMDRHFAGSGYRFHPSGAGADWLLECEQPLVCGSVEPEAAAGRNLRDLMPGGRDGARVRALVNEIQMLLHEHPVNTARRSRGLPAVNSLWLWGFGRMEEPSAARLPALFTDDAWLAGLWRLHGAVVQPLTEFAAAGAGGDHGRLVGWSRAPAGSAQEVLAAVDADCFAPARTSLARGGTVGVAALLGDAAISTDRAARFRFWRRRRPLHEVLR